MKQLEWLNFLPSQRQMGRTFFCNGQTIASTVRQWRRKRGEKRDSLTYFTIFLTLISGPHFSLSSHLIHPFIVNLSLKWKIIKIIMYFLGKREERKRKGGESLRAGKLKEKRKEILVAWTLKKITLE